MNVLHPPFSGFPVVIMTIILAAEVLSFFYAREKAREFAWVLWWVLAVCVPVTYFSGYFGSEYASNTFEVSQELIAEHQAIAKLFVISAVPCILFAAVRRDPENSKPGIDWVYRFFLALAYSLVILTSFRGGRLVFEHGAGVTAEIPVDQPVVQPVVQPADDTADKKESK